MSGQRINPGRTSLKVLMSKEGKPGKVGFSGRPIQNWLSVDIPLQYSLTKVAHNTYVVDENT